MQLSKIKRGFLISKNTSKPSSSLRSSYAGWEPSPNPEILQERRRTPGEPLSFPQPAAPRAAPRGAGGGGELGCLSPGPARPTSPGPAERGRGSGERDGERDGERPRRRRRWNAGPVTRSPPAPPPSQKKSFKPLKMASRRCSRPLLK